MRVIGALLAVAVAGGCAGINGPRCASLPGGYYCLQPSTALAPRDAVQRVDIAMGELRETVIVALEIDHAGLRVVAVTPFGQKLIEMEYDNKVLHGGAAAPQLDPMLLAMLVQLALWPADAVRNGLSESLMMDANSGHRRIVYDGETLVSVEYEGQTRGRMRIRVPQAGLFALVHDLHAPSGVEPAP